jgi:hypothetical protein
VSWFASATGSSRYTNMGIRTRPCSSISGGDTAAYDSDPSSSVPVLRGRNGMAGGTNREELLAYPLKAQLVRLQPPMRFPHYVIM